MRGLVRPGSEGKLIGGAAVIGNVLRARALPAPAIRSSTWQEPPSGRDKARSFVPSTSFDPRRRFRRIDGRCTALRLRECRSPGPGDARLHRRENGG